MTKEKESGELATVLEERDALNKRVLDLEDAADAMLIKIGQLQEEQHHLHRAVNDMALGRLTLHCEAQGWRVRKHAPTWASSLYPSAIEAVLATEIEEAI